MESLFVWLSQNAAYAHYIVFGLLVLAGFSFPISEDILVILSGVLASTVIPEKTSELFIAAFLGSYFSDWIAYGIGRYFGEKADKFRLFRNFLSEKNKAKFRVFYEKYGFWVLMIGRCIPFGLRNGIFMTAGAGRMHFGKFLISDGIACLGFSALLFTIAFFCGKRFEELSSWLHNFGLIMLSLCILSIVGYFIWQKRKQRIEQNI